MRQCPECGAQYAGDGDSCSARFEQLLALDHSRREPWGSRHGQAFSAFALQHPDRFASSLDVAWAALYRIYCENEAPLAVFRALRNGVVDGERRLPHDAQGLARPMAKPTMTIADLKDFSADAYATLLDAWCVATLRAYGQSVTWPWPHEG